MALTTSMCLYDPCAQWTTVNRKKKKLDNKQEMKKPFSVIRKPIPYQSAQRNFSKDVSRNCASKTQYQPNTPPAKNLINKSKPTIICSLSNVPWTYLCGYFKTFIANYVLGDNEFEEQHAKASALKRDNTRISSSTYFCAKSLKRLLVVQDGEEIIFMTCAEVDAIKVILNSRGSPRIRRNKQTLVCNRKHYFSNHDTDIVSFANLSSVKKLEGKEAGIFLLSLKTNNAHNNFRKASG